VVRSDSRKQAMSKTQKGRSFYWLLLPFYLLTGNIPVLAADNVLGVVRNSENASQWSGITARLQSSGIPYCVVDLQQVRQPSDFGNVRVLFLPNVETIASGQLQAVQDWVRQGGKTIASGPVGTLSQPDVRSNLRSLLGAYWSFSLNGPTTIEPLQSDRWFNSAELAGTVRGGVIIPSELNSQTTAIWRSNQNPPAVVATEQSVFFGWRWGIDAVSPSPLDSAWLKAALNRYGALPPAQVANANGTEQSCLTGTAVAPPNNAIAANNPKIESTPTVRIPPPNPIAAPAISAPRLSILNPLPSPQASPSLQAGDVPIAPPVLEIKPGSQPLPPSEVTAMRNELTNMIGRFETALLSANALNGATLASNPSSLKSTVAMSASENSFLASATRAVERAKDSLQTFMQLAQKQDFNGARQQWIQARRMLWDNYPTNHKIAEAETRALWLDRGTIVTAKSEQDLAQIFDRIAAAGINTVFFEAVNASYPIYPSQVAPEQNPMTVGWDPLEAAVKLAHARGIELHAWVWMFAAGNQRHNVLLNKPDDYPGPVLAAHPDWAAVDRQGGMLHQPSKKMFLDPANPEVRQYLSNLLDEIASRYQVDGIQLDYIRYPFQDPTSANRSFGYSKVAREAFKQQYGIDPARISPSQRDMWQKWNDFRVQQVDSFVAEVSQRLHSKRPELILSAAVFGMPREERLVVIHQNWEAWAQRGDIDLMVPMTYALETNQLQDLAQPLLEKTALNSTLVLPGIRLLNLPDAVAIDQIQLLRNLPAGGYSLFAFENLNPRLQSVFNRTQGNGTQPSAEPIPYRQPFQAAANRYSALRREWDFLLESNQIALSEPVLSQWKQQVAELSKLLNELAEKPGSDRLSAAKLALTAFRSQFSQWMQLQATQQPYQVQVWHNRLATLDRLLAYGERVVLQRQGAALSNR